MVVLTAKPAVEVPRDLRNLVDSDKDAFKPGQSRKDAAARLAEHLYPTETMNLENHGTGVPVYGFPIPVHLRSQTLRKLKLREKYGLQAVAYQMADGTVIFDMDPDLLLESFEFLWCGLVCGMWDATLIKQLTGENDLKRVMQRGEMPVVTKPIPMSWCGKSIIDTQAREHWNVTIIGYKLDGKQTLFPHPLLERLPSDRTCELLFSVVSSSALHKIINRTRTDLREEEIARAGYAGGVQV